MFYWIFLYNGYCSSWLLLGRKFQSLFYWIFLYNFWNYHELILWNIVSILVLLDLPLQLTPIHIRVLPSRCFNPCFIGSSSTTRGVSNDSRDKNQVSILVLLDLPLQPIQEAIIHMISMRFNPCFIGSSSTTTYFSIRESAYKMFQSLFYWIFLYNHKKI